MASQKTNIIENLFYAPSRWRKGALIKSVVTLADVHDAINSHNNKLGKIAISPKNPANFFKDFVRNITTANKNWPPSVLTAGYTGRQRTGKGDSFEFVSLPAGQTTAFATHSTTYPKSPTLAQVLIAQTLSLPILTKALARSDENWLQSISVALHLPQQHLAVNTRHALHFVEVGHMQSNMKLNKTEIDGLFYGRLTNGNLVLVTMEAKGARDDILDTQVLDQVGAVQQMPEVLRLLTALKTKPADTMILPMAMKVVPAACHADVPAPNGFVPCGRRLLYMADYGPIAFSGPKPTTLTMGAETLFDLRPPITGINV